MVSSNSPSTSVKIISEAEALASARISRTMAENTAKRSSDCCSWQTSRDLRTFFTVSLAFHLRHWEASWARTVQSMASTESHRQSVESNTKNALKLSDFESSATMST